MRALLAPKLVLALLGAVALGGSVAVSWFWIGFGYVTGESSPGIVVGLSGTSAPVAFALGAIALIGLAAAGRAGLTDPLVRAGLGVGVATLAVLAAIVLTANETASRSFGVPRDDIQDLTLTWEPGVYLAFLAVLLPLISLLLPDRASQVTQAPPPEPGGSDGADVLDLTVRGL